MPLSVHSSSFHAEMIAVWIAFFCSFGLFNTALIFAPVNFALSGSMRSYSSSPFRVFLLNLSRLRALPALLNQNSFSLFFFFPSRFLFLRFFRFTSERDPFYVFDPLYPFFFPLAAGQAFTPPLVEIEIQSLFQPMPLRS